ncbi:MAG: MBL fold metallo-hydrolase [Clostridiales bacterium]|nr:MBL fold metallo-hydrolase [Clostridiales bacterium]
MLVKCFTVGSIQANCYIVTDEKTLDCAVIDPGAESNTIMNYLEENRLKCRFILLTHGHFDHTGAVEEIQKQTGAVICINSMDIARKPFELAYKYKLPRCGATFISEGDTLRVGSLSIDVLETPGHSEGGVTFRCDGALFTGDTLFRDSIGRTDFPGCSYKSMMSSLRKLYNLKGDYEVYPGHMEPTSLERERRCNYFIQDAIRSE